jgi:phenylalanyl-tRNA synthetase alpha chain
MITYKTHETFTIALTPEGAQIAQEGSHEARVWAALPAKGEGEPFTEKQLQEKVGAEAANVGRSRAFKNRWIANEGAGFVKSVSLECGRTVS